MFFKSENKGNHSVLAFSTFNKKCSMHEVVVVAAAYLKPLVQSQIM